AEYTPKELYALKQQVDMPAVFTQTAV
nr:methylcobalamin: coenzyme M methyltransferase isoenzyme II {N-terminal} [Methanosarcina barkeri, H2/CO2-grown cells, Peptide Partial, 26 aa] [Methanosarcina barkeri]AAB27761.1 methylcobalamin: coenzyme M methyltransferase isoenzyme II {N-terminal} [Methanosarcina barkeri, trimethylamine-grown cells, Peptide Partial, 26 aa] [Methanosarcina barkeri]